MAFSRARGPSLQRRRARARPGTRAAAPRASRDRAAVARPRAAIRRAAACPPGSRRSRRTPRSAPRSGPAPLRAARPREKVEKLAHLGGGHPGEITQRDHGALVGRETVHRLEQLRAQLGAEQAAHRVTVEPRRRAPPMPGVVERCRIDRGLIGGADRGERDAPGVTRGAGSRLVHEDAEDPGPQRRAPLERGIENLLVPGTQPLDKHVLLFHGTRQPIDFGWPRWCLHSLRRPPPVTASG